MLTEKQTKILNGLEKYIRDYDRSPSIRELQSILGIKSPRSISQYLDTLESKGYIQRSGEHRGIRLMSLANTSNGFLDIPILGYANCGQPLTFAQEERIGVLQVDRKLVGKNSSNLFAVVAKG